MSNSSTSLIPELPRVVYYAAILGFVIGEARERKNMTTTALAMRCGFSPSEWPQIESGHKPLSFVATGKIAAYLGMSMSGIIAQVEEGTESATMQGISVLYSDFVPITDKTVKAQLAMVLRGKNSKYALVGKSAPHGKHHR